MKKTIITGLSVIVLCLGLVTTVSAKPKLNCKKIYMSTADKKKLKVTGTKKKVKWKSSKKSVARVTQKGTVIPSWFGTTTITAKVGKHTLKCKVYVKEEEFWYDKSQKYCIRVMDITKKKTRIIVQAKDKFTITAKHNSNAYEFTKKGKDGRRYYNFVNSRGVGCLNYKQNGKDKTIYFYKMEEAA